MCGLSVYDEPTQRRSGERGVREILLDCIAGTTEPNRAAQFDRTSGPPRRRAPLAARLDGLAPRRDAAADLGRPVGDGYAIRDGHHRVSVAKARGALTINANVA